MYMKAVVMESSFNEIFSHWDIRLPREAVEQRGRGKIVQQGWAIWFLFGADEQGEYLDFYSSHRMTDDSHTRIREDGTREALPAIQSFRISSPDPQEDARLQAEYYARNQAVAKMLEEKGFGPTGDEPGGVLINRLLHLKKIEDP